MGDPTATFAVELEDKTSGACASAAQGLEKLRTQIEGDTKSLAAMQRAMKNLQGASVVNIKQFRQLNEQILAKKNAIAQAQGSFVSLGGTFGKTGGAGRGLEARFAALAKQANGMPGPLGGLLNRLQSLKGLVGGGAISLGLVGIAAALLALVAATGVAVAALYRYGVAQADARRSELLRIEGLTKVRNWYGLAAGNAGLMQESIDKVAASSALGRDKIAGYSDQLYRMGMRGENLAAALEGVAIKASVQGEAQASMFMNWSAGIARTGGSVRKFADDVKARLGGVAAKQMESLTVQAEKQKEAFDALFGGIKIDAFLKAKKTVSDLFSQSTASGRALKQMLELLLQPLVNSATKAQPIIKRFFQGMILGAQDIVIVLLDVALAFKRTFGSPKLKSDFDATHAALVAGKIAVVLLGAGLATAAVLTVGLSMKLTGMLVPALFRTTGALIRFSLSGLTGAIAGLGRMTLAAWSAVPALWAAAAPMLPFVAAALGVGAAIYVLTTRWKELKLAFKQLDWAQAGKDAISGILSGLFPGYSLIKKSLSGLGASALKSLKDALGIHSPSKAFAQLGIAIPRGVGVGVEQGVPALREQVRDMVPAPSIPTAPATPEPSNAPRGRSAKGGGGTVTIGEIHLHTSSDKPRELAFALRDELASILEGVAIEMGAPIGGAV